MEKFKEKLNLLRQEADSAVDRAEKAEAELKDVKFQLSQKEQEIQVLQTSKQYHVELHDKAKSDLSEVTRKHLEESSTRQNTDFQIQSLQKQLDNKEEKISVLEEEVKSLKKQLEEWEKSLSEL